jgi:hypothetical protein
VSKRTDMLHGRRGGRFVPDGYTPTDIIGAPRCDACGGQMVVGQKKRHHACDAESMVGERCTCRPGCTDQLVGDGPIDCDAACVPCKLMQNRLHKSVPEWTR